MTPAWPTFDQWLIAGIIRGLVLGAAYTGGTFLWIVVVEATSTAWLLVAAVPIGATLGALIGCMAGLAAGVVGTWDRRRRLSPNLAAVLTVLVGGAVTAVATLGATGNRNVALYWIVGPTALAVASLIVVPVRTSG